MFYNARRVFGEYTSLSRVIVDLGLKLFPEMKVRIILHGILVNNNIIFYRIFDDKNLRVYLHRDITNIRGVILEVLHLDFMGRSVGKGSVHPLFIL